MELVNKEGVFCGVYGLEPFFKEGACDTEYGVVSVIGRRSVHKAKLLDALFETDTIVSDEQRFRRGHSAGTPTFTGQKQRRVKECIP